MYILKYWDVFVVEWTGKDVKLLYHHKGLERNLQRFQFIQSNQHDNFIVDSLRQINAYVYMYTCLFLVLGHYLNQ